MSKITRVGRIEQSSGLFDVTGEQWELCPAYWSDGKRIGDDVTWHVLRVSNLVATACQDWLLGSDLDMSQVDLVGRLKFEMVHPPLGVIWGYAEILEKEAKVDKCAACLCEDWRSTFGECERKLIAHCQAYAQNDPAGMPGHALALIISQLADLLDQGRAKSES